MSAQHETHRRELLRVRTARELRATLRGERATPMALMGRGINKMSAIGVARSQRMICSFRASA